MFVFFGGVLLIILVLLIPAGHKTLEALRELRRTLRWRRGLKRPVTAGFDHLPLGEAALKGRVRPIDPLRSDWSDREGVYLCYATSRLEASPSVVGVITEGQWVPAESEELIAPFELSDGERSVLIDPEGARVFAPARTIERESLQGRARRAEEMIETDAEVIVVGQLEHETGFDASRGYRGHSSRPVVRGRKPGDLLIADPDLLGTNLGLGLTGALLWTLPSLALIAAALISLSNALPWNTVDLPGELRDEPPQWSMVTFTYGPEWLDQPGVTVEGTARVSTTYFGYGLLAGSRFSRLVIDELERRHLDGIIGEVQIERRFLIFHEISIEGDAIRR